MIEIFLQNFELKTKNKVKFKEDRTMQFHIVMTSRKLRTGIKEHIADIKCNKR